nr:TraR/DksA C4-type zinc finger protein [Hyphomonas sp. Mor2]
MKTPTDPDLKDLADVAGKSTRRKRGETDLIAEAKLACPLSHTHSGRNGTETLALIERALYRLADGSYGKCIACGAEISVQRLDQNPTIETCASCDAPAPFKAH